MKKFAHKMEVEVRLRDAQNALLLSSAFPPGGPLEHMLGAMAHMYKWMQHAEDEAETAKEEALIDGDNQPVANNQFVDMRRLEMMHADSPYASIMAGVSDLSQSALEKMIGQSADGKEFDQLAGYLVALYRVSLIICSEQDKLESE